MKEFIYGFFGSLFCLILINATPQINNKFSKERAVYDEITNLYDTVQTRQFKIYTTTPNANNLKEREIVIVSTGANSLFTKIGTNTYSTALLKSN